MNTRLWYSVPKQAGCVKISEMLDIFSTPSKSPYLGGESIFFCHRNFPSPSIGGRVGDGGNYNLKKSFSQSLGVWEREIIGCWQQEINMMFKTRNLMVSGTKKSITKPSKIYLFPNPCFGTHN